MITVAACFPGLQGVNAYGEGRPGELTTPLAIPISPGYSKISVEVDVSTPTARRPVSRRNPGGVRQNDFCLNMVRQEG
jgi:hypothetical protein